MLDIEAAVDRSISSGADNYCHFNTPTDQYRAHSTHSATRTNRSSDNSNMRSGESVACAIDIDDLAEERVPMNMSRYSSHSFDEETPSMAYKYGPAATLCTVHESMRVSVGESKIAGGPLKYQRQNFHSHNSHSSHSVAHCGRLERLLVTWCTGLTVATLHSLTQVLTHSSGAGSVSYKDISSS